MESKILTMRPDIYTSTYGLRSLIEWAKFTAKTINVMVEIGSYQGESTELFAKMLPNTTIFAVDPWKTGYDETDEASFSPMEEVMALFDKRMLGYQNVIKYRATSLDAAANFETTIFDLVYIDGNHTLEAVTQDIETWLPKIRKGGILAGHDYNGAVKEVVDSKFPNAISFSDSSWATVV